MVSSVTDLPCKDFDQLILSSHFPSLASLEKGSLVNQEKSSTRQKGGTHTHSAVNAWQSGLEHQFFV